MHSTGKLDNLELAFFFMPTQVSTVHRCKTRRTLLLSSLGVFCIIAWLLHSWLLSGLARLAITDNAKPTATYLALYQENVNGSNSRIYDAVAKAYHEDPRRRILILEPREHTLQKYGILPDFVSLSRQELAQRGVADSAMEEVGGAAPDYWRAVRSLKNWLQDQPDAEVVVYCFRFESRYRSYIAGCVLEPEMAARVSFYAMPTLDFDETNWWKCRDGVKDCMFAHLSLLYARFNGETEEYATSWNPDKFVPESK
jgi:hypothetical protein